MGDVDLVNRDPNNINSHLKCAFEDVLAEPDDIHSIDICWKISYQCFTFWRNICYRLWTFFFGWIYVMELGCGFACIMISQIWGITPCLRVFAICCNPIQKLWGICCNCCVSPICEAFGMLFSNIRMTKSTA